MSGKRINPAKSPPITARKQKNLTDPTEIIHAEDITKPGKTLCGLKCRYYTSGKPDCVVCLDILEVRYNRK